MDRAFLCVSWLLLPIVAAGCAGQPHGQGADTPGLIARDSLERMARRERPPSPEAATVLRKLGHVDEAGKVLTTGIYDAERLDYLEAELHRVSARLGPDGKLYDRNGREVYFLDTGPGTGCQPPPLPPEVARRQSEEAEEHMRELRKRYTVIVLPFFGIPPP